MLLVLRGSGLGSIALIRGVRQGFVRSLFAVNVSVGREQAKKERTRQVWHARSEWDGGGTTVYPLPWLSCQKKIARRGHT